MKAVKKTFSNFEFIFLESLELEKRNDGSLIEFMPQERYAKKHIFPLNKYGLGPFCCFKLKTKITSSGIYVLQNNSRVLYIGETNNLSRRYSSSGYGGISPKNCYKGGQETNCRINNLILQEVMKGEDLDLWFLEKNLDKAERVVIEAQLVKELKPLWNK